MSKYEDFKEWIENSKYSFKCCTEDIDYCQVFQEFEWNMHEKNIEKDIQDTIASSFADSIMSKDSFRDMTKRMYNELKCNGYLK